MDTSVTGIAALATNLATQKSSDQINIDVLKTALNSQKTAAEGLINAIPASPTPSATSSIGHNIDTSA